MRGAEQTIVNQTPHELDEGMDLRDYFAIKLLQANLSSREQWLASMADRGLENPYTYVCTQAYSLADEMLKARNKIT
jgi:hypothetical protein